jgi:threonine/homoserine/homoserine lactone efflux protein
MDRQDRRIIIAGDERAGMADTWRRYLSIGLRWVVRLFLALFIAIAITTWTDLFFDPVVSEHLIGSEHACAIHYANCSWRSYIFAELLPLSLLAGVAIVTLAWRRLRRRETILNILALLAFAYLAWTAIYVQLAVRAMMQTPDPGSPADSVQ